MTLDADKACTATFDLASTPISYTLNIATSGDGSGVVTPTVGMPSYISGTVVTLEATPDVGSTFAGWSGAPDCVDGAVTLDADKLCTATFTRVTTSCTALTGVTLAVQTPGTLYIDSAVRLRADLAPPDDATKPYTYTVDYDDGSGPSDPLSSNDDPLSLSHTWSNPGTYTVTIAVWNCGMTEPLTDTVAVTVEEVPVQEHFIYLPFFVRSAP